jgi:hypothetical protein
VPGIRLPELSEVAAVAGWPGVRSLFRPGWTSFAGDRVSVYHRLDEEGIGPSIEVTTYVDGGLVDRSTVSFLLEQMRAHKSPPREERAELSLDGQAVPCSVHRSRTAWVAVSDDASPRLTVVAREFPIGAVFLERVALTSLDGYDRLAAPVGQ